MARRSQRKRLSRPASPVERPYLPAAVAIRRGRDLIVEAPQHFSLSSNFEEAVLFLNAIRRMIIYRRSVGRVRRIIDLSPIKRMGVGAAVVLAAEADRWRQTLGIRPVPYDAESWHPSVRTMVEALGIFELMGPEPLPAFEAERGFIMMPLRSGTGSMELGPSTADFLASLVELVGPLKGRQAFYDGICEAILNACHHAYNPSFLRPGEPGWTSRRWWAAGGYLRDDRRLKLLVYDQGVGIPATLPASKVWHPVTQFLKGKPTDSEMIRGALDYRISRTNELGRGEGLAQLATLVDQSQTGFLRILSGSGELIYNRKSSETRDFPLELGGTLVAWEIGLPPKEASGAGT